MKTVLVVEDELSIRSFLSVNLKRNGYRVLEAENGEEALEIFRENEINLILLDLMLPGIDGFYVCKEVRKLNAAVGIIMLTAKTQEKDKIEGLVKGADDYIIKPFSMAEVEARITSLLRRMDTSSTKGNNRIKTGPFEVDLDSKQISKDGTNIKLTPTEYSILKLLIQNKNKIISRDELLNEVWGIYYNGDIKVVDVNIRRIRKSIEIDPSKPEYLCTVWGYGYMWKD